MRIRLDKLLADTGRWSRSEARELIRAGRVRVDGAAETRPEAKLDPERARVEADGETLTYRAHRYFMLDKPAGVLTATEDPAAPTVLSLLPPELRRLGLFPVGRLDKDTTGLLLLTDDGDYAHRVISPRNEVDKVYLAEVAGPLGAADERAFAAGLTLGDGTRCRSAALRVLPDGRCLVTVREGKYHQVKRMLASRGAPVTALRRLSVGSLQIDENLGPGGFRELSEEEKNAVFQPK